MKRRIWLSATAPSSGSAPSPATYKNGVSNRRSESASTTVGSRTGSSRVRSRSSRASVRIAVGRGSQAPS